MGGGAALMGALLATEMPLDANEQLQLGQRLYYKMLRSFLETEEKRLRQTNFSALLNNGSFHTSLLACCLESVFASLSALAGSFFTWSTIFWRVSGFFRASSLAFFTTLRAWPLANPLSVSIGRDMRRLRSDGVDGVWRPR